jgi:hypothetical protein
LVLHVDKNQDATRKANRQTQDVEQGESFVFKQIAPG